MIAEDITKMEAQLEKPKVEKKLELKGTETSPLYIKEGDRV